MSTAFFGLRRAASAVLVATVLSAAPASGQTASVQTGDLSPLVRGVVARPPTSFVFNQASDEKPSQDSKAQSKRSSAPVLMTALHAATVTSHVLDVHSTIRALDSGAGEANPLMFGVSGNRAALIGVKAALGAGVIYATHRIAKRSKTAAVLASAAVNSLLLTAAHHNYSIARQMQPH